MADEVRFAADLYRGAAADFEQYRPPYPAAMTADLVRSAQVSGRGRLLDLACGTGQLAFPLRGWFAEVWAVDQEPDMVEAVRAKAAIAGAWILSGRWCRARRRLASSRSISSWPSSATHSTGWTGIWPLAGSSAGSSQVATWRCAGLPSPGPVSKAGSRALAAALDRWKAALGAEQRIPVGWEEARSRRPDSDVLSDAGFELAGSHELAIDHRWTLPELAGLIRSTSFLPAVVLADQATAFDADLAASLGPHSDDGVFTDTVTFVCELAQSRGQQARTQWLAWPVGAGEDRPSAARGWVGRRRGSGPAGRRGA